MTDRSHASHCFLARRLLAISGSIVGVLALGASVRCASAEQLQPNEDGPLDAGSDPTPRQDQSAGESGHDSHPETAVVEHDDGDGDTEAAGDEVCSRDAGRSDDSTKPCEPAAREWAWCGACGWHERTCGAGGVWGDWTDCMEDEWAECLPCESRMVGCGFCATRAVYCHADQGVCRWVLGACTALGQCLPGDFEAVADGCSEGLARVRWCSGSCEWEDPTDCTAEPHWESIIASPLSARARFAAVSFGGSLLVWGGQDPSGAYQEDGAWFEPTAGGWRSTAPAAWPGDVDGGSSEGQLSGRMDMAAVWAGDEIFLWGGEGPAGVLGDGARLDLDGKWSGISPNGAPTPRSGASALWTHSVGLVLLWGGRGAYGNAVPGGGRYEMATDAWTPIADGPFKGLRGQSAVWDSVHARMIVWGGSSDDGSPPERSGASYDPLENEWSTISDAPIRRTDHVAFWDARTERMIVLFGRDGVWNGVRGDGAAYDPQKDSWTMVSDVAVTGYAIGRGFSVVSASDSVWVTGGEGQQMGELSHLGARYNPVTDSWSRLPPMKYGRTDQAAWYSGGLMVWGGRSEDLVQPEGEQLLGMP